jgi:hypothetical protein
MTVFMVLILYTKIITQYRIPKFYETDPNDMKSFNELITIGWIIIAFEYAALALSIL